jgi:hypothetical protein
VLAVAFGDLVNVYHTDGSIARCADALGDY